MTTDDEPALDAAFAEYLRLVDQAAEQQQLVDRTAFLQRYPAIAPRLAELIEIATALDGFVGHHSHTEETLHWTPGRSATTDVDGLALTAAESAKLTTPGKPTAAGKPNSGSGPKLPYDLGDYRLLSVLGQGGMGVVYEAEQKGLGRRVAVKMIRSGILASEAEVRRFATEAKAAAALQHRNIVAVYQSGYLEGHYYFSMEYVPGNDLGKLIKQAPLTPANAARYVRDVARAIDHAHRRGVLHRDLKPANVLITPEDEVRVTDFGLAKHIDTDSSLTGSGTAIGTPSYMAPEQAAGHSDRVQIQSDVYALGAILFAAVAGKPPFGGEGAMQTLLQVIHQPPPSLQSVATDCPDDLDTIVAKCLAKSPDDRYRTAIALADDLDAFLEGRPIKARPHGLLTRIRHWLEQVPLVAAVLGRRVIEPSREHRRFQAGMLCLLVLLPLLAAGAWWMNSVLDQRLPSKIRLAGGLPGGMYDSFARDLAQRLQATSGRPVFVRPSSGSVDNIHQLTNGQVDLAPMQASVLGGDSVCVIAPLYFEAIHVMVRQESSFQSLDEVRGHPIAVGPHGSGSRLATELLLDAISIPIEVSPRQTLAWTDLQDPTLENAPEVAIICIGKQSPMLVEMLSRHGDQPAPWRLLPVPHAVELSLQHPILRPLSIGPKDYPAADLPPEGLTTIGTTAFLVGRWDTPDRLVTAALTAIYVSDNPLPGLIPRDRAAEWQGLGFHPAARRFFGAQ